MIALTFGSRDARGRFFVPEEEELSEKACALRRSDRARNRDCSVSSYANRKTGDERIDQVYTRHDESDGDKW